MEIQGKLHKKYDTQQVSDKFAKREFILIYAENALYPQYIKFEITQEKCALLDRFNEDDTLSVVFNLRGREYLSPQGEKKYFTSLEAWKIDKAAGDAGSTQDLANRSPKLPGEGSDDPFDNNDDLTF